MDTPFTIDRPPRIQPELPVDEIEIPAPPEQETNGWMRILQVGLPLITIVGYLIIAAVGGSGRRPIYMIPMAMAMVASVIFSIYTYRREQREMAEKRRRYDAHLIKLSKEMRAHHDDQRRFHHYNYPDLDASLRLVEETIDEAKQSHQRTLRSRARLWERRVADDDFAVVRLGIGTLPSTVIYVLQDADPLSDDPQMRAAMKLDEDSRYVDDIPVIVSMRNAQSDDPLGAESEEASILAPVAHAVGVAGEKQAVYSYVRALLAQFTIFHAPMDARLYILADHQRPWAWAETLPHSSGDEQTRQCCFLDTIQTTGNGDGFDFDEEGELEQFLEQIRKMLAQRKLRLENSDNNDEKSDASSVAQPFQLIVVDMLDAVYAKESPLAEIESDAAISIILDEGQRLGAAVLFLAPERSKIPSKCQAVVEIERTTPHANRKSQRTATLHFRYAETGVNTTRYIGRADHIARTSTVDDLAKALAGCRVRKSFGAEIANSVPFLDMMGYDSLRALQQDVAQRWQRSIEQLNSDWLRAKLGLMSGNKTRTLVFSAKRDGVHGMVAGSTGSGKSELLISLITGMAVSYDPSVINFVLVDFKGGGAFDAFKGLPHCVNVITNLNQDGVTRMFTAIRSEMQRRQWLNTRTETKDIVEYRQKGLHLAGKDGGPGEPYPFLFIIIDEFAEMISERAEFRTELESITRVGRAQGVSLILAAQRPSGVSDQMRANIKFRICLRVETPAESRELLRRTDAAFLPSGLPGRGLLQIGSDELEMVQVAYTGEPYSDPAPVLWPARRRGETLAPYRETPELYKVIITLLGRAAREQGVPRQLAPWPDFLPQEVRLTELLVSDDINAVAITSREYLDESEKITLGEEWDSSLTLNPAVNKWMNGECGWVEAPDWTAYAIRPVTGLVDNPYSAKQLPMTIDLPRGHVVMFGASGWGKTTFVRTLIVSLAATHSPDHVHFYILDLGGRNLGFMENIPHVGAVINPDEEGYRERVDQLLRELEDIVSARKELLANAGEPDIYKYNETYAESSTIPSTRRPLPAMVVVIDNFVEFQETFDTGDENIESTYDKYVELARQGKPYGVHLVITISHVGAMPHKLFNLFTERITLKLADATEYRAVVGGHVGEIADVPGRGYIRIGAHPLSFQVAQPFDLRRPFSTETINELQELESFANNMNDFLAGAARSYTTPIQIGALPKSLLYKQMLSRQWSLDLDERFLAQLRTRAGINWRTSLETREADWLKVVIGAVSGGRPREMHFEAKLDGVHGLVAGGTGSGKSELLMTLIVGLALRYSPDILNFVLVDYKGGGAFQPFRELPHCVDTITNLNKSGVKRMFTAIDAEMRRRQQLNTETKTHDIVEYRSEGYHLTREPYPHLFVIIDEYAEMITDNPEFKQQLDSITRLGRAQGVNLLLAAQRPIGVTDQMRANIKFRICLRVEGTDTSREMLRRSDAAFLPSGLPGRGYLQIGNENIELIQVAYTGETYPYAEVPEGGRPPKFYDVVVDLTQDLLSGERPRTPWPPPLPEDLTLSSPLAEEYWENEDIVRISLGQETAMELNPFVCEWLQDEIGWRGVDWSTNALRAVVGLVDDPHNARQLPLVVDFSRGHAVLFGASGWGKTTFIRTLITSLAATHRPDEFHAHILDLGGRNLEALRSLPHVGALIMPDERGYEERVQQLLRELDNIVDERKNLLSEVGASTLYEYNSNYPERAQPAIVIAVDNFGEFIETFGDQTQTKESDSLLGRFIALARQGKAYGLHFVITVGRLNALSSPIYSLFTERMTLRLADPDDYRAIVGGGGLIIDEIPGRGYVRIGRQPLGFQIGIAVDAIGELKQVSSESKRIGYLGRKMTEIGRDVWSGSGPLSIEALPTASFYRQVLAELNDFSVEPDYVNSLIAAMRRNWAHTASPEAADWLEFPIGITSGGHTRIVHMSAVTDGVHGLIAGGTGSGKSELLLTMIVGLVVNYDPSILNLVLVDYKGGGAFRPFENLPHCVDIVTNLNKAAVDRMFTAISAEIRRRQMLNVETGTKDIIDYRRKGLHLTREPYPHLFVIIDEYAEMIDDNPEYRAELESITRVGRAQGINLILASQRPKGVTDQMRANIKLRICLRVEELDTSREMLRRPDAAYLPNGLPGRGYLQVGNENIELIQVSYTGEKQPDDRTPAVLWPARTSAETPSTTDEDPRLFETAVMAAAELNQGQPVPKPWPNFLPEAFSLETPLVNAQDREARTFALQPIISDWQNGESAALWAGVNWGEDAQQAIAGLIDDPTEARQSPLVFDFAQTHLIIFGDSGAGKTSMLHTIALGLAASHSPDELHMYVLDLGGRNFTAFEALPHMGTVIYADEEAYEERLNRLLTKLTRMLSDRQKYLSENDAASLTDYNAHTSGQGKGQEQGLAAIVVFIDNLPELWENYTSLVESTLIPLVRRSQSVGISFVVTANVHTSLPSKLYSLFGERITFRQTDPDRYMDIVGRGAIDFGGIPGRGYMRADRKALMFHAALPTGLVSGAAAGATQDVEDIRLIAAQMERHMEETDFERRTHPDPIQTLPELTRLEKMIDESAPLIQGRTLAVLGQNNELEPALFDLRRMGPHFMITGPPFSGKTTILYNWVFSLAWRNSPKRIKILLVDLQRRFAHYGGERDLGDLPHVLDVINEIEEMERIMPQLRRECQLLAADDNDDELYIFIDSFDDFSDELQTQRDLQQDLATLARRFGRDGLHVVIAGTLDDSANDFRRRVQSSNFGIGLRVVESLDKLRVGKRPAGLYDRELPVGRGFSVKSGQATLLQVASPYEREMPPQRTEIESEEEADARKAQALDNWVTAILARHPGEQRAGWTEAGGEDESKQEAIDPEMLQLLEIMRRIAYKYTDKDQRVATWDHVRVLSELVKKALSDSELMGDAVIVESVMSKIDGTENIIFTAQGVLPEVDGSDVDGKGDNR